MGIRLHLNLFDAAADAEDFGNAPDALQSPLDGPIGQGSKVHEGNGMILAADADEQNLPHQRGDRRESCPGLRRQGVGHRLQALLHQLPGAVDIRAPGKFGKYQG